ncbi:MAG: coagulation factor 5/8 type domain protein, partial [Acidimicrobiales bacterium]|nr:coagulation factor 5/8 type domain protein [Acidimicrobiales bacterium]
TIGCSLWWIAGLWAQGSYGIDILRYTETAETVGSASAAQEVLRSLGYWFFYGEDTYGPWISPSKLYTQRLWMLCVSYLVPILALAGAAVARFRERAFFALLVVAGAFLAVGGHPWSSPPPAGRVVKAFLLSNIGLSMRSLPRAVPLLALGMAVFLGAGIAALTAERRRFSRPAAAGAVALAILALPPLWTGKLVDANLDRPEDIPSYWKADIAALDARGHDTRVLELPGADFASYRWGTTVDPITPGLMDRPYVARELIPYGSPPSADLLDALDRQIQEGVLDPSALAPMARLMGVGDINVRSDLTFERYNTPRPKLLWNLVTHAPGLGTPRGFGGDAPNVPRPQLPMRDETELVTPSSYPNPPKVAIVPVQDPERIVRTASADRPVLMAGDGEGVVDAAEAGLLSGHELLLYSAGLADQPALLKDQLAKHATLLLTDTNRRRGLTWSTVRENTGATERAGQQALRFEPKDQRLDLFPKAGDAASTVVIGQGGAWAEATGYGNAVSLTPEDQAANAIDGNPVTGTQVAGTAWKVGGFESAVGEAIKVHYEHAVTTDKIRLIQALGGVRNRFITRVRLTFDDGKSVTVPIDRSSREQPGQVVSIPKHTFRTLLVTIDQTDPGKQYRYDGASAVGFSVIDVQPGSAASPVGSDIVRLPTDLLRAAGAGSLDHPLTVLLSRLRTAPNNAVRSDEERQLARAFTLPTARSFALTGTARLANGASDDTLDHVLGIPGASSGGVTATSKRRLPGGFANRASSAIDGDLSTWYSPGFLDQRDERVTYEVAKPITFDHMDLTVLDDGRHSVPQRIRLEVDGKVATAVDLPHIGDQAAPGAHHTFHLKLPKIRGRKISVIVDTTPASVREVTTRDYYSRQQVAMPIGFVEVGIPGLRVRPPSGQVDSRCRRDLVSIDGHWIGVSLHGRVADLVAGRPVDVRLCDARDVRLPAGTTTLRSALGSGPGINIDGLTLRSAAGGRADRGSGPLTPASVTRSRPDLRVTHAGRTSFDVEVGPSKQASWLILGQSNNLGWKATVGGKDLGAPVLVDGYANGWQLPPGSQAVNVHLEWAPQRVVWVAIVLSLLAVLAALVLIVRSRLPADDPERRRPLDARPSMPRPFRLDRVLRYAGPRPSTFATTATVLGALAVGG